MPPGTVWPSYTTKRNSRLVGQNWDGYFCLRDFSSVFLSRPIRYPSVKTETHKPITAINSPNVNIPFTLLSGQTRCSLHRYFPYTEGLNSQSLRISRKASPSPVSRDTPPPFYHTNGIKRPWWCIFRADFPIASCCISLPRQMVSVKQYNSSPRTVLCTVVRPLV